MRDRMNFGNTKISKLEEMRKNRIKGFMSNVRSEIVKLSKRKKKITWEEYSEMRTNSYERRILIENFDNNALIELTNYCIGQVGFPLGKYEIAKHYNDAIIRELAPLLIKRLKEK